MRLRTRLVLVFVVLAIVPMTAIVVYGYVSSMAAFKRAAHAEAMDAAEQLNRRMAETRENLEQVLTRASRERFAALVTPDGRIAADEQDLQDLRAEMGSVAPLVHSCEFIPSAASVPEAPQPPALLERQEGGTEATVPPGAVAPRLAPPGTGHEVRTTVAAAVAGGGAGDVYVIELEAGDLDGSGDADGSDADGDRPITIRIQAPAAPIDSMVAMLGKEGEQAARRLAAETGLLDPEMAGSLARLGSEQLGERLSRLSDGAVRIDRRSSDMAEVHRQIAERVLGCSLSFEVQHGDTVVGRLQAEIKPEQLLGVVLGHVRQDQGEVPFAIDREGALYTVHDEDRRIVEALPIRYPSGVTGGASMPEQGLKNGIDDRPAAGGGMAGSGARLDDDDWMVVQTRDPISGMSFGVARPVGKGLEEIRRNAVQRLGFGVLLVAFAGFGILPVSARLTRNLGRLTGAAQSLAGGDLTVRVPERSRDEVGELERAFNQMAIDLEQHQARLVEQERLRQEQALRTRLLESENARQTCELEAARAFQLSLLPSHLPERPDLDIAVSMRTATEVGGDYYDFRTAADGSLTATIGDATGHGAAAGTLVTVAKSLFTVEAEAGPRSFLCGASKAIRSMRLGRMSMAMLVARIGGGRMCFSAAGMPPPLVHRAASGMIEELMLPGVPLGALSQAEYGERNIELSPGDTLLFMSDGFPELPDAQGEPLGYERAARHFSDVVGQSPSEIIAALESAADSWRGERAQNDDITFVVMRVRREA